jgi:AbiJ N-terminal domain 4
MAEPISLADAVCEALLKLPDENNWSSGNVSREVTMLVRDAQWFKIYDIAERLYAAIAERAPFDVDQFQQQVNALFREHGIGWAMEGGQVVARGGEAFTAIPKEAIAVLEQAGRSTAANEIHQAMQDLSRRPKPDITGAMQHSMAALECVMKDATNEPKKTLGQVIGELNLPKPLDDAIEKLWGFASNHGRHLAEGKDPAVEDAELVVTVAAAVALYLSR